MSAKKIFIVLVVFAVVLVISSAQIIFRGPCPENVQSVDSFDVERYLGMWYEFGKYPQEYERERYGRCVTAKYTLNDEGNIDVQNSLINNKTNRYDDINGTAILESPGKLMVGYMIMQDYTVYSNYWVLDTDYDNYAVVYSCVPRPIDVHAVNIWILTRERHEAREELANVAFEVLKKNDISVEDIIMTPQDSCDVSDE